MACPKIELNSLGTNPPKPETRTRTLNSGSSKNSIKNSLRTNPPKPETRMMTLTVACPKIALNSLGTNPPKPETSKTGFEQTKIRKEIY